MKVPLKFIAHFLAEVSPSWLVYTRY